MSDLPRRCYVNKLTPEELKIREAILEVEKLGAHVMLTEVVTKLTDAKDRLADWIDLDKPEPWVK